MPKVTSEQPRRGPCDWAYCTRPDDAGYYAVGYVTATNRRDAAQQAKRIVERRRAKVLGFKGVRAYRAHAKRYKENNKGRAPKGWFPRIFVWRDNLHECERPTTA